MATLTYTLPTTGKPDFTQDPLIVAAFTAILAWAAGTISGTNIAEGGIEARNLNGECPKATGEYVAAKHAWGSEFTPSATRPVFINVVGTPKASEAGNITVKVDGKNAGVVQSLPNASNESSVIGVYGILVPAGVAVKIEGTHMVSEAETFTTTC